MDDMIQIYTRRYIKYDFLYSVPRIIRKEEVRYKPILGTFEPKSVHWDKYKELENGDTIYVLDSKQRTLPWEMNRIGRITSSVASKCIGLTSYGRPDLVTTALEVAYYQRPNVSPELQKFADDGIANEPQVKLHCEMFYKCKIKDIGFLVPSWKTYLGDSPDGEVTIEKNGIVQTWSAEFKALVKLYRTLEERLEIIAEGGDIDKNDFSHIKPEHYVQCHVHMYCMQTSYCIYHVCDFHESKFFSQVIPFNKKFWEWCLKRLDYFYENYLLPITRTTEFPLPLHSF